MKIAKHLRFAAVVTLAIIQSYTTAASLHDIGKVSIADEILKMLGNVEPKKRSVMRPKYFDSEVAEATQARLDDFRNIAACCLSQ